MLASVLLWASRADATRITFDPNRDSPLVYSNASLDCIETEVPAPPDQVAQTFLQYLRDIATGDRFFGMLRSGAKFDGDSVTVVINVPDVETPTVHRWILTVNEFTATFKQELDRTQMCFDCENGG